MPARALAIAVNALVHAVTVAEAALCSLANYAEIIPCIVVPKLAAKSVNSIPLSSARR